MICCDNSGTDSSRMPTSCVTGFRRVSGSIGEPGFIVASGSMAVSRFVVLKESCVGIDGTISGVGIIGGIVGDLSDPFINSRSTSSFDLSSSVSGVRLSSNDIRLSCKERRLILTSTWRILLLVGFSSTSNRKCSLI